MILMKCLYLTELAKKQKNRITAVLLAFVMMLTLVPTTTFAADGDCSCPPGHTGDHVATCPLYRCPNCGAPDCYGDCPDPDENPDAGEGDEPGAGEGEDPGTGEGEDPGTGEGEDPGTGEGDEPGTGEGDEPGTGEGDEPGEGEDPDAGEGDEPSVEPDLCDICGSDPCTCPDYVFHVGKIAALNPDGAPLIFVTEDAPDEDWTEYCLDFYPEDFSTDVLFQIDDYKVVTESVSEDVVEGIAETPDEGDESISSQTLESLWYQVHIVKGSAIDSFTDGSWIFQNYLDDDPAYDTLLIGEHEKCPVCGEYDCETEHVKCPACGEYDCTTEHVKCDICGGYDCKHTWCGVCGDMDCTAGHVYCPVCEDFDCGLEHETEPEEPPYVPPTEPVIPQDPQLPDGYDVAIVDAAGNLVTGEAPFRLAWNAKTSLSAWSALGEDVTYQWQILCGDEDAGWVDISGQTGQGLLFSRAMLSSVLDEDNCAYVRCVTESAGSQKEISEPICVALDDAASPEETIEITVDEPGFFSRLLNRVSEFSLFSALAVDNSDHVSVTINYWTADSLGSDTKKQQFNPYVANIIKGEPFKQNVVSPPYLGYAAFYDYDGDGVIDKSDPLAKATTFNPNLDAVMEDTVIDLYFLPIEVPFSIRYFFQNINDDDYTEKTDLYYTGMLETGTVVNDAFLQACLEEKNGGPLPGYTKMHHEPEKIAADGSTEFECYYDREYYMVAFSIGQDAFGVEPIYARYGAPVLVSNPVRPGYTFGGWDQMPYNNVTGKFDSGDGSPDSLPNILPAENRKYAAIWTPAIANYTVLYWLQEDTGNSYLGQSTGTGYTGAIATLDIFNCGHIAHTHSLSCYENCTLEEHDHVAEGCSKSSTPSCGKEEHTHTWSCYTTTKEPTAGRPSNGNAGSAFDILPTATSNSPPQNGYVYRVRPNSYSIIYYYYNFFRVNDKWYYLGTGNANTTSGDITHESLSNPDRGKYNSAKATPNESQCVLQEHTHDDSCYAWTCGKVAHTHSESCCGLEEHTHTDSCSAGLPFDADRKEYVTHDTDVVIAGDGSSVLNVYYKYEDYTLRFYYGRTSASYGPQVVGGTTNPFGSGRLPGGGKNTYSATTPVSTMLSAVNQWGQVQTDLSNLEAVFNENGLNRIAETIDGQPNEEKVYTFGTYTVGSYTYYYLEFTAPYNSNLKNLWPVDIFNPLPIVGTHSQTALKDAYFSAWNGEYRVKYTQDHISGNETIKGLYLYLDDNLLFDPAFAENYSSAYPDIDDGCKRISYLCFWENGANIGWSIPKLFEYRLWVSPTGGHVGTTTYGSDKTANYYTNTHPQYRSEFDAYELYEEFNVYDNSAPSEQTSTYIRGYNENPVLLDKSLGKTTEANGMEHYIINYFYDCDGYKLSLQNMGTEIPVNDDVAYGAKLKDILASVLGNDACEPPYPTGTLEEGGYYFEGWYTSEDFTAQTKIDLETAAMTPHNLKLFARWLPKTHNVRFFYNLTDLNEYLAGQTVPIYETRSVEHNWTVGGSDPEHPLTHPSDDHDDTTDNQYMEFVRWFYLDNGKKVAFSVDETPIKKDLNVYAEWRDKRIQSFKISYKLLEDKTTPVADDHTGYAYLSTTRTFTAKSGNPDNQLYSQYSSGYFPTVASHSILMEYEADLDNPLKNVYDFFYTKVKEVSYKVKYVNSVTGVTMEEETFTTEDNVVTVAFKPVEGFTPDAFYKRLVLSVKETSPGSGVYVGNDDANVITFYYTPNTTQAYYAVHYMEEVLGKDGVYEESHWDQGLGLIGQTVNIEVTSIPGFKLTSTAKYTVGSGAQQTVSVNGSTISIPITAEGTALYVYYDRLSYNYVVHYYEYNTTTPLQESIFGTAEYEAKVSQTAPSIANWTCVSAQLTSTITIREESAPAGSLADPVNNVKQNKIVFYYLPKQYTVDYVAVPSVGGKIFPSTRETISGNQALEGVTLTAGDYYEFDGWYTDEACTQEVTADVYDVYNKGTGAFKPKKSALSDIGVNTFYAKFKPLAADFTIQRSGGAPGEVFVYLVEGVDNDLRIELTVTTDAQGEGSTTIGNLPFGTYKVTQQQSWSWRHGEQDSATTITHDAASSIVDGRTVAFYETQPILKWLTGISRWIRRIFGGT